MERTEVQLAFQGVTTPMGVHKMNNSHETIERSRRFYEKHVAGLIHEKFREYEDRIAVGLVGEGSDCFGYDDLISRDHDFGTGVCLWVTDEDMENFTNFHPRCRSIMPDA